MSTCTDASATHAISGAIFDCDGTLVDSMPMWNSLVEEVFDEYGIAKTEELLAEAEAYNFDDMCYWLHDAFRVGESGEAVLATLRERVRDHYRNDISAFPGVRAFLDELAAAGVRMLVLSATTEPEVWLALRVHGLDGYFERVIPVSETGSDKEHEQAYRYALDALGTPPETTWVFEDAPFALRTAHGMGLHTICLFNDHDGRDIAFCQKHCDILARSYAELSLTLLDDYARVPSYVESDLRALVVAGSPEASAPALVARLAAAGDYVIAADQGVHACRAAGVVPDLVCGDADSMGAEDLAWVEEADVREIRYPSEKYATDLAIAFEAARHEAARRHARLHLVVTCASGGRLDHQLGVLGNLLNVADAQPWLVEDGFECRILSPDGAREWQVGTEPHAVGATFSVVPLAETSVVSEEGMRWGLDHRALPRLADEGISNVVESRDARIVCHEGAVAAFLMRNAHD